MEGIGTVSALWRYPVKSMQGEGLARLDVDEQGVRGDRAWGVVDTESGKLLTAKLVGQLLTASARTEDASVVITLSGGVDHEAGDPETDVALSEWLGRPVALRRPDGSGGTPFELTLDPADDDSGLWDFATPPASLVDLAAFHVLTTASLDAIAAADPTEQWDVRRFRPNALVSLGDVEADGFAEDAWVGAIVALGAVQLSPFMPTPRCALPTRAQPGGLDASKGIARSLKTHNTNNLGVYCTVTTAGAVAVGDLVTVAAP